MITDQGPQLQLAAAAAELTCSCVACLQVLGQSRSWLLRLLQYEDEVFAVVSLLLERHSLANLHATFAESLYGLKRQPVQHQHHQPASSKSSSRQQANASSSSSSSSAALAAAGVQVASSDTPLLLNKQQQRQALLCQVCMPQPSSHTQYTIMASCMTVYCSDADGHCNTSNQAFTHSCLHHTGAPFPHVQPKHTHRHQQGQPHYLCVNDEP